MLRLPNSSGEVMDTRELIRALGGPAAVARKLRRTTSAVSLWLRDNAVPAEHHVTVWNMAAEAGLDWTPPGAEDLRARLTAATPAKAEAA